MFPGSQPWHMYTAIPTFPAQESRGGRHRFNLFLNPEIIEGTQHSMANARSHITHFDPPAPTEFMTTLLKEPTTANLAFKKKRVSKLTAPTNAMNMLAKTFSGEYSPGLEGAPCIV